MEHYFLIKHLHMTAAAVTITLFVVRAWWSVQESPHLNARWIKVLPHLIDTALLGLGGDLDGVAFRVALAASLAWRQTAGAAGLYWRWLHRD